MPYEVISASLDRKPIGRPTITIQSNGSMRANREAAQMLKELGAERVLVLWDRQKRKLALSTAAKNDPRSYKLLYGRRGKGVQISAKQWVRQIGWSAERSVRIPVHLSENMLEGTIPPEYLKTTAPAIKQPINREPKKEQ